MKKFIVLFLSVLFFAACGPFALKHKMEAAMSSKIVLPDNMLKVYQGNTYPIGDSLATGLKLIVYVDSLRCSSCFISRIEIFDELFELQSKYDEAYTPIIMFGSNRIEGLTVPHRLEQMRLDFPVYLDPKNEFLESNPSLAKDQRLHSILVDGDGKPVMIGNPIDNPKLLVLFEEYLEALR